MTTALAKKKVLLLVEDNAADADLVQELLDREGDDEYEICHVVQIADAVKTLTGSEVDAVLLDLRLPDAEGVQSVQKVKSVKGDIPIIVLTGIADEDLALSCIDAGAQDYVVKSEMGGHVLDRAIAYALTRQKEIRKLEIQEEERRRIAVQMGQSQKMEALGQLAGGIAHDFNNLLVVINGYTEELIDAGNCDTEEMELLKEINRAGESAANLTRQLLAFGRKSYVEAVIVNLNSIVEEIETMMRRLIGENFTLIIRLDPALGNVKADPSQMKQVLMNLLINARDSMEGGGKITVETKAVHLVGGDASGNGNLEPGHYAELAVSDTGIGMDEETRNRVFEPFFTTKEAGKGTGLGLATTFGIVKHSGGIVTVESEVGEGSTFRVLLPIAQEAASSSEVPKLPAEFNLKGTETVLLAEDDPAVQKYVERTLHKKGYTVLKADDGEAALEVARRHEGTIDLLLTDVVMPKVSGLQLAREINQERPEMKVIYMSGYADDAIISEGETPSQINLLQKPFRIASLVRIVREVLDARAK